MSEQEIVELAAILVKEHGHAALDVARRRQAQYAHAPRSYSFEVWSRIAAATARLLEATEREKV